MKASTTYIDFKKIANLKQCAVRELSLSKLHLQYVLKVNTNENNDVGF